MSVLCVALPTEPVLKKSGVHSIEHVLSAHFNIWSGHIIHLFSLTLVAQRLGVVEPAIVMADGRYFISQPRQGILQVTR